MTSTLKTTTLLRKHIASIEDELLRLEQQRAELKQQADSLADELGQHKEALNILIEHSKPKAQEA